MEALGIDLKLLLAQIINFLILFLILRKLLYGPIVNMLEERKDKIKKGIDEAERAAKALDEATSQSKKILADATQESSRIVANAKKEIEQETQKRMTAAKESASNIVDKANQQAKLEQQKIVTNAKKEIAELVIATSEKIIGQKSNEKDIKKAIEAIK